MFFAVTYFPDLLESLGNRTHLTFLLSVIQIRDTCQGVAVFLGALIDLTSSVTVFKAQCASAPSWEDHC